MAVMWWMPSSFTVSPCCCARNNIAPLGFPDQCVKDWGYTIHGLSILVFILALIGPRTARTIGMGFGLAALLTIQIALVGARDDAPGLAALHPVLALFALGLAFHMGMPLLSRRRGASAPRPAQ